MSVCTHMRILVHTYVYASACTCSCICTRMYMRSGSSSCTHSHSIQAFVCLCSILFHISMSFCPHGCFSGFLVHTVVPHPVLLLFVLKAYPRGFGEAIASLYKDYEGTIKNNAAQLLESSDSMPGVIDVKALFAIAGGGHGSRKWKDARLGDVFRFLTSSP